MHRLLNPYLTNFYAARDLSPIPDLSRYKIAWIAISDEMMHGGGQRVQVRAWVRVALVLLWRRVVRRQNPGHIRILNSGSAEVDQLHLAVPADKNIAGINIPVENARLMNRL